MEILVILLFIVLIILIASFRGRALERIGNLEREIARLRKDLEAAPRAVEVEKRPVEVMTRPTQAEKGPAATAQRPAEARRDKADGPVASPEESEPFVPAAIRRPVPASEIQPGAEVTRPHVFQPTTSSGAVRKSPPPVEKPGFFERHPDLEKFIGENLVSKIGIGVLVLAIGFFVKYAIDNEWIGPVGRVGIGVLCGGILIGIAHFLRNSYKAFSSVLVGGGLAVLYFSIALAYHQYGLFSQSASFVIMLVITAFAVILSLLYDRQELAIIALVGGFVTPFLVSNGSGNYKVLFSYLLILNTGLLVMAYRKAWRLLNVLAFGFTAILFASWLATLPEGQDTPSTYGGALLFATSFYILFFIINIAHNIRENKKFIASDFGILLANTCLYFAAGLYLLAAMGLTKYQGLFSASMAVFNLVTSYFLFRKKKVDSNVLYLLIGITLTFISLTAPIQLHGHYITLFWASESVLLYWLARKSGIRIIEWASLVVWAAMLVSLVMDWGAVYIIRLDKRPLPVVFNKGLITTLYAGACTYALFFMRRKAGTAGMILNAMVIVASLLLFIGGALEIDHQFEFFYPETRISTLYLLLYGFLWSFCVTYIMDRRRWFDNPLFAMGLLIFSLATYLANIPDIFSIQTALATPGLQAHFMAHWVTALLVAMMIHRCIAWWRKGMLEALSPKAFSWLICIFIIIFLSAEVGLLVNAVFYSKSLSFDRIGTVYVKTGLPILWGLSSFIFMWLGMRHKFKPLRIISLALFSVTLLKLFLFDIQNIPVAGKIAAFFCLGVILLVVSFMYQRLKKIIIEDEEKKTA
ncbi:DUF2339 domain-containing protein [Flavitalea sp. BT771]|uniref:DUF2339 domain-containing protein n=1 Tax=Flavitalea sp. BT771 TaxID=3063329 RepID=UPI0026E3AE46|nr:DUF2339 domain-containing protein [Flavitalea sp. BT771]MDO6433621.1 DUF2339 domain-containing protein [Flavitalea sp. BT771]MDV6222474.1 DUF2339 domain-containing protein [Flavitalea sp. BT771]